MLYYCIYKNGKYLKVCLYLEICCKADGIECKTDFKGMVKKLLSYLLVWSTQKGGLKTLQVQEQNWYKTANTEHKNQVMKN